MYQYCFAIYSNYYTFAWHWYKQSLNGILKGQSITRMYFSSKEHLHLIINIINRDIKVPFCYLI